MNSLAALQMLDETATAEATAAPSTTLPTRTPRRKNRKLQRIGPYKILKTIGVGSFSRVQLAKHEPTGQKVAIKVLPRASLGAAQQREIEILKFLEHPNIIRIYEVVYTDDYVYMVVEYVAGGELFDYLVDHKHLSEGQARLFFQQLISAVEYCHARRVVHRDIKPENLLLGADHTLKLADFGLSTFMKDGFFLETSCGSFNYASPEIVQGAVYAGPEVDVWSCGVVLFFMLVGRLPFDDPNVATLFGLINRAEFSIPSSVSGPAADLLRRMLVVDPVQRIRIPEIRAHAFFRKNLSAFLSTPARDIILREEAQDDPGVLQGVVEAGAAMNWSLPDVSKALGMGDELLVASRQDFKDKQGVDIAEEDWLNLRAMALTTHMVREQQRTRGQDPRKVALTPAKHYQHLAATVKRRWLFGYVSTLSPQVVMKHLFDTLLRLGHVCVYTVILPTNVCPL